jgi:hypothetical protein
MREGPRPGPHGRRPAQSPPAQSGPGPVDRDQPLWRRAASREGPPRPLPPRRDAPPAWPSVADERDADGRLPRPAPRDSAPQVASYLDEDDRAYLLRDLDGGGETHVPKRRAAPEPFPPTSKSRAAGAGLLRASGYALLGALLGGAPGVALGALVALIALVRLAAFQRRAHMWRALAEESDAASRLPTRATSERFRLMAALWQGLGAMALGGAALFLFFTALR